MEVEILTRKKEPHYEEFLLNYPRSLLYYSLKYRDFLQGHLSAQPEYYIAVERDEIVGILPLFKKEGTLGAVYNSLPYYGSNGGIIARNEAVSRALLNRYQGLASQPSTAAATLVTHPFMEADYSGLKADHLDKRIAQFTPLDKAKNLDALMEQVESSTRRNIKKAQKSGVTVEVDNDQWDFLQKTHEDNMKAIGGKAKKPEFFSQARHCFAPDKDYEIWVARINEVPIGALLLFYYNKTVEYFTPAIVEEFRTYQALPLIIAEAMVAASKKSFSWWNWGGTWLSQEGVYRFKKKWGTEEREYLYHISVRNPSIYRCSKDTLMQEYADFFVIPFELLQRG